MRVKFDNKVFLCTEARKESAIMIITVPERMFPFKIDMETDEAATECLDLLLADGWYDFSNYKPVC